MADEKHLAWLNEGVAAWNARRERDLFQPDLQGANLVGRDLRGADLRGADLTGADLEGASLRWANLVGADLTAADLREANIRRVNLQGTSLQGANLQGADVRSDDTRTGSDFSSGPNKEEASAHHKGVDLSTASNLTQAQLDVMNGDRWTIIPDHLARPAHWIGRSADNPPQADPEPTEPSTGSYGHAVYGGEPSGNPEPAEDSATGDSDEGGSRLANNIFQQRTRARVASSSIAEVRARFVVAHEAVQRESGSALSQIAAFREWLRGHNQLGEDDRARLGHFVDEMEREIRALLASLPETQDAIDEPTVAEIESRFERYRRRLGGSIDDLFSPDSLADATLPIAVILSCGAFGGAVGALVGQPLLGFGVGGHVGKLLIGEAKPGKATDDIRREIEQGRNDGG